jgi:hypothetical protein
LFQSAGIKRDLFELSNRIHHLTLQNGNTFAVMYLKEAVRLTMKRIAGHPEKCITFPRVATRRGLPLIIPGKIRLLIEADDLGVTKIVLSLLSIYRVMKARAVLNLNTIVSPFKGVTSYFQEDELK